MKVAINDSVSKALPFIRSAEKFEAKAYWDSYGKIWTIGYGTTVYQDGSPVRPGQVISRQKAEYELQAMARAKAAYIAPHIKVPLTAGQFGALISLAYNWGEGRVVKSNLLKAINAQAPKDTIKQIYLKTAVTAKGVYVPGLANRRAKEWAMYSASTMPVIGLAAVPLAFLAYEFFK